MTVKEILYYWFRNIEEKEILYYWFRNIEETEAYLSERNQVWWRKQPGIDGEITKQFEPVLKEIVQGGYVNWQESPGGWCASILVLDQFSRHIYRGKAGAFSQDNLAIEIAKKGLGKDFDKQLHPVQRVFCYLPFEHSEKMADQKFSVELFRALVKDAPTAFLGQFNEHLEYAEKHLNVIERFGRFPHRNIILGRKSTPEEMEFLKQPGSTF